VTDVDGPTLDRRTFLGATAGVASGALAGCGALSPGDDATTTPVESDRASELAERFAPTLYFDTGERWFPTDPRPYATEQGGEMAVDGFTALNDYTRQFSERGEPPAPTLWHNVVAYDDSPLAVVQYWAYSVFDQFTTNFHWHDWEVLHVFVDTETDDPVLFVASSHSRTVPNNEFLDPDRTVPRILSELGSHSSALSINDVPAQFQRLPIGEGIADITNRVIDGVEALASLPIAYGLPRDEGGRLPFAVPELDGAPVYDHDRLPDVEREDLVPEALTIRSFDALSAPPTDLPARETGLVFEYEDRSETETTPDVTYAVRPASEIEAISDFTGPQLSFEFAVPQAAEDAIASHITTTGAPWNQPRYTNPAADISDPTHRQALADRYDAIGAPAPVNDIVTVVSSVVEDDEAPDGGGVTTEQSTTEAVALVESDPTAIPTFRGVAVARGVESGEHRLTVNGAGVAPHSERVTVGTESGDGDGETSDGDDDTSTDTDSDAAGTVTTAGVDGEIPLVAREAATKLAVDPSGTDADLADLAVEDDFGGRLYDAPIDGPEAVYVHRGGAYTSEVRDTDDAIGAFRVNPAEEERVAIDQPDTGKASLSAFLATITDEIRADIEGVDLDGRANALGGLTRALESIGSAAESAATRASEGDRSGADRQLRTVSTALEQVASNLERAADALPDPVERSVDKRLAQVDRRLEQAIESEKLSP